METGFEDADQVELGREFEDLARQVQQSDPDWNQIAVTASCLSDEAQERA